MKEPSLKLPQPLARALLNYLIEKPYKEVIILINALNNLEKESASGQEVTDNIGNDPTRNSIGRIK